MSDADPPRPSSGTDAADALSAVLRDQAERQRRRAAPPGKAPRRSTGPLPWAFVAVGAAVSAWLWMAPPAAVAPPPLPTPSPAEVEAGLRMDLYVTVLRIEAFRDSVGRLPASLEEVFDAPAEVEGMLYEPLERGTFRVGAYRGDAVVSYRSDRPVGELLGSAPARLGAGGP